jgi:hypothetical protein
MNSIKFVLLVQVCKFGIYMGFFLPQIIVNYLDTDCQVNSICYKIIYFPCISFTVCSYKVFHGKV